MDEMIDRITAPYFNDLDFGWTDDGDVAVRYHTVDLSTSERVSKRRMISAANAAARILSRTGVPFKDNYGFDDLVHAYARGYHDGSDGREPRPETIWMGE